MSASDLARTHQTGNDSKESQQSLVGSKINRSGLETGTLAPEFRLKSVTGEELWLGSHRGHQLLLVFSDPTCGPCNELSPKLAKLHLRTPDIAVLMISRGDAEANAKKVAEHHLSFPVGLQRHWEVSRLYGLFATPSAYLIDEQGIIAAPPAIGAVAILNLLTGAAILSLLRGGAEPTKEPPLPTDAERPS
jgi:peroxiredoxin